MTVTMFNLDNLNVDRPEALQGVAQGRGQIPKSTNEFIEKLAQRVHEANLNSNWEELAMGQI